MQDILAAPRHEEAPPPLAPDLYSFTYKDSFTPSQQIHERLCVDAQVGVFAWRRYTVQDGVEVETGDGAVWATSLVGSVRFTTTWGDPSREFLLATQPNLLRRRELLKRLSLFAATLKRIVMFALNPVSVLLVLSCVLTEELWRVFPTGADGAYNMSESANEAALTWATLVSVLSLLVTVIAGWWIGVLRIAFFKQDSAFFGKFNRLPSVVSELWGFQRYVNAAVLLAFLAWCLFSLVVCSVALVLNSQEECLPYVSPSAGASSSAVPYVHYHKFDIALRLEGEEPITVILSALEDPLAVIHSVMPVQIPPGTPARLDAEEEDLDGRPSTLVGSTLGSQAGAASGAPSRRSTRPEEERLRILALSVQSPSERDKRREEEAAQWC